MDGGYLGADFETFFSAVVLGAAGVFVGILTEDAGIATDLTITTGQRVSVSGDRALPTAPVWGSGGFTVQQLGSLELTYVAVQATKLSVLGGGSASLSACVGLDLLTITVRSGGSLSLSSTSVPITTLGEAESQLGPGSTLRLSAVSLQEVPDAGELTGTMTVGEDGSRSINPPNAFGGTFTVSSGPCKVSAGGRCVGRPHGYDPSEDCSIVIGGGGGVLGACTVFDTEGVRSDFLTLPDGSTRGGSNCPSGLLLAPGASLSWHSDNTNQGNRGGNYDNGCGAEGTCGQPWSHHSLGGGWVVCFA